MLISVSISVWIRNNGKLHRLCNFLFVFVFCRSGRSFLLIFCPFMTINAVSWNYLAWKHHVNNDKSNWIIMAVWLKVQGHTMVSTMVTRITTFRSALTIVTMKLLFVIYIIFRSLLCYKHSSLRGWGRGRYVLIITQHVKSDVAWQTTVSARNSQIGISNYPIIQCNCWAVELNTIYSCIKKGYPIITKTISVKTYTTMCSTTTHNRHNRISLLLGQRLPKQLYMLLRFFFEV